jgi:hypothetical protein
VTQQQQPREKIIILEPFLDRQMGITIFFSHTHFVVLKIELGIQCLQNINPIRSKTIYFRQMIGFPTQALMSFNSPIRLNKKAS